MPFTPAITYKFTKVGTPGTATTLAAPGFTNGVTTSINVGSTTNWPTDTLVRFGIDVATIVNGLEVRTAGTYNEFSGIVTSATTIGSLTREYGTAQNYNASSLTRVYIPVAATRENALIDGLGQDHNLKGNHKSLTDDNALVWLERGSVASAVNQVKASNAITGGQPRLDGNGNDALVDLYLGAKGGGVAHVENPEVLPANFVASGGVVAISAGLVGTFSNMIFYVAGKRYKKTTVVNKTYTASKDTYVDAANSTDATVVYTEVANGAAAPALAANSIRIAKVVTSGAAITSITQDPFSDGIGNIFRPTAPASPAKIQNPYKFSVYRAAAANSGTGAFALITFDTKLFDTGNNYNTATGLFTAPVAGFYQFNWLVSIATGTNQFVTSLFKNGADFKRGTGLQVTNFTQWAGAGSALVQMAAGDTASIQAFGDAARALQVLANPYTTTFEGFLISAS